MDFMCCQLGVSRSGHYAWRARPLSDRARTDADLSVIITALFERPPSMTQARGNPGVRRMAAMLRAAGHGLSRRRVHRLIRTAGLQGRHPMA